MSVVYDGSWKISVLVENTTARPGLLTEHGLSLWIETPDGCVLFDAGQGLTLWQNAKSLGVDFSRAEALVLSHGHYDHTGGIPVFLRENTRARIFAHRQVVQERFSIHDGQSPRSIGMPTASRVALEAVSARIAWVEKPVEIIPHVWATGSIPRRTSFEDTGGPFYLDSEGRIPDLIPDDQALWLDTKHGLIVVLGCAHSGVVNTLDYVAEVTGSRQVHAVVGGFHLGHSSEERIRQTAAALDRFGVKQIAPNHCTGAAAADMMSAQLPGRVVSVHAGDWLSWE